MSMIKKIFITFTFIVFSFTFSYANDHIKGETIYNNEDNSIKIVIHNGFLLKIYKNEKGLNVVEELGYYPEAYPQELPKPEKLKNED